MQFKKEAIDKLKAHGEQVAQALKDYTDFISYSPIYNFTKEEDADLPAEQWEEKYRKQIALAGELRGKFHQHLILTVHETGRFEYALKNEVIENHWVLDADNWNKYLQYFNLHIEKRVTGYPKNPLQWVEDIIKDHPKLKHVLEEGKPLKEYTSKWIDEYFLQGEVLPPGQLLVLYMQYLQDSIAAFYDTAEELRPAKASQGAAPVEQAEPLIPLELDKISHKILVLYELGILDQLTDNYPSLKTQKNLQALLALLLGVDAEKENKTGTIRRTLTYLHATGEQAVQTGKGIAAVKGQLEKIGIEVKRLKDVNEIKKRRQAAAKK